MVIINKKTYEWLSPLFLALFLKLVQWRTVWYPIITKFSLKRIHRDHISPILQFCRSNEETLVELGVAGDLTTFKTGLVSDDGFFGDAEFVVCVVGLGFAPWIGVFLGAALKEA